LDRSGLISDQLTAVRESDAHGPPLAAFRDVEARAVDIEADFPSLVARQSLVDAEDVASVLHNRVEGWTKVAGRKRLGATNLIAGLIPRVIGVTDPDMAQSLMERDRAIESRAATLAEQAVERNAGWVRRLGRPPVDPTHRAVWMSQVGVVAAYRDRWGPGGQTVVGRGADASTIEQLGHHMRAQLPGQKAPEGADDQQAHGGQNQEHTTPGDDGRAERGDLGPLPR